MNKIIKKIQYSEKVYRFDVEAPLIAKSRKAGNFVIIRVDANSERMPLTIADADIEKGTITLVVQKVGLSSTKLCHLNEGDEIHEMLGWIMPRFNQFSVNRSYFSWLMGKKEYVIDARIKGGERHMIMSNEYDRVFPMDIFPEQLVKAIITGDIDRMEALGIYEVAPEDFALCEFVDSSKLEVQRIVREGLDMLRKEMA